MLRYSQHGLWGNANGPDAVRLLPPGGIYLGGNRHLDLTMVLLGSAALMVLAGIRMLRDPGTAGGDCALPGGGINWHSCLSKTIGAGLAVGFVTGMFGSAAVS